MNVAQPNPYSDLTSIRPIDYGSLSFLLGREAKRARHVNDHACWLEARDGRGAKKESTLTSLSRKKMSNYAQYDACS